MTADAKHNVQIDYFNKRRVLEERQRMMYAAGAQPLANAAGATASR